MKIYSIIIIFLSLSGSLASRSEPILTTISAFFPAGTLELGQLDIGSRLVATMTCPQPALGFLAALYGPNFLSSSPVTPTPTTVDPYVTTLDYTI